MKKDDELSEELRAHLAMAARERMERGESAEEAMANARRELGNTLLIQEATRTSWAWPRLESLLRDFRYVVRQARRSPGFTAIAISTLALGIAATTTMFTVVDGVLLKPLRYPHPEQLHLVRTVPPTDSKLTGEYPVNARQFQEWRTKCTSCESVALVRFDEFTLLGGGAPLRVPAYSVTYNFFRTLGVQPAIGRDFLPEEESSLGYVILSHALWQDRFASDPSVVGRDITINGEAHRVVGVMPRGFSLPKGEDWGAMFGPNESPLLFRTVGLRYERLRPVGNMNYSCVARLKPGVQLKQAADEMNALLSEFRRTHQLQTNITLLPMQSQITKRARAALWLLLATVGTVLLIVCVNIGNLMLVRTTSRYREAGIRSALGAGRGHLFGLVVKEAVLLVTAGGALGWLMASYAVQAFAANAPVNLPRLDEIAIDYRALLFAFGLIAVSTMLCCVLPAWKLSRIEPLDSLRGGTATESGRRVGLRESLVGVEVALSATLLIVGGLLLTSFVKLLHQDLGFEASHVITQDVSFLSPKYARGVRRNVTAELARQFAEIPQVTSAGAVNQLPLIGEDWVTSLQDPANRRGSAEEVLANLRFVTPGYFDAMRIRLKQGRFLTDADQNRPVAVISERAARFLWPGLNPIGRHVEGGGSPTPVLEVVGVVSEVNAGGLETPTMMIYEHYWRMQPISMSYTVRTRGNPDEVIRAMRDVLTKADPEMAIQPARTMEQILDEAVAPRRFEMALAVAFAAAALLLASMGIYGMVAYSVTRRTGEIGIRIALGADRARLVRMVIGEALRPVLFGLAIGAVTGVVLSRLIASQLFGVTPGDPFNVASVMALLLAVASLACWIPALRAARTDPMRALRYDN